MGLKKTQEMEYAKFLYIDKNLSQKDIAERVGVEEKTLIKWIDQNGWKALKRSLANTNEAQLKNFYDQLEWLNDQIATRPIVYDIPAILLKPVKCKRDDGTEELTYPDYNPKDFPILVGNVATSKEGDVISKLTASINRLRVETSVGEIYEVAKQAIELAREESLPFAKQVTALFDVLINSRIKK